MNINNHIFLHNTTNSVYANTPAGFLGTIRVDAGNIEVYTSSGWQQVVQQPTMTVSYDLEKALAWAIDQQQRNEKISKLAETNPAVQSALKNFTESQKVLDLLVALVDSDNTQNG